MCAAPFSCVGDPRSALLGSVQFLFWFRLISPELRDVLAKRSPARGFSAAPCGSLWILTAMPSLVTNSAGTVLIPVPISPPKMDGIEQFVRWGAARLGGSCHAWGDARPDRALGCVDCYARFARARYSYQSHTMRALRAVAYLTNALQVRSLVPGDAAARLPGSSSKWT
jgi:hypothetical protein